MRALSLSIILLAIIFIAVPAVAIPISDGSDGLFMPSASTTADPGDDNRFDFTQVMINSGLVVDIANTGGGKSFVTLDTSNVILAGPIVLPTSPVSEPATCLLLGLGLLGFCGMSRKIVSGRP